MKEIKKNKLAVGIIGLGVGLHHFKAFDNNPKTYVKYVCDLDNRKLDQFKNKNLRIKITNNSEEIFKDKDIKIVSIASFDECHFDQIMKSIKNNKHIMVEKPLCLEKYQLKKINAAMSKKNLILSSNMVLRTNPRFNFIKKSISKSIKSIYYIEAEYLWGRPEKLQGWRKKTKNYSLILGASIHMIDLVLFLIKKKPIYVKAIGNKLDIGKSIINSETFIGLDLIFNNGLIVRINTHATCKFPHFHNLRIFSNNYTIISDINGCFKTGKNNKFNVINKEYPFKSNRHLIIDSFISKIFKKYDDYFVSFKEINILMSVCFSAIESLKKNKSIKIRY
tara:strand:- start:1136 stop:2140 length:1005 start_codon:yes stop_codon:yes gene_type:complete